jgi:hypothetical protein
MAIRCNPIKKLKKGQPMERILLKNPSGQKNNDQKHRQIKSSRSIKTSYNSSGSDVFSEFSLNHREIPKPGFLSAESERFIQHQEWICAGFLDARARIHLCRLVLAPFEVPK